MSEKSRRELRMELAALMIVMDDAQYAAAIESARSMLTAAQKIEAVLIGAELAKPGHEGPCPH